MLSIQQLSQELDIGVDTLRAWERRYGFPTPERDYRGHRIYSSDQLEELRIVKKLQNHGLRPSAIFALSPAQRKAELSQMSTPSGSEISEFDQFIMATPDVIRATLKKQFQTLALNQLIQDHLLPLIVALDHGWVSNKISIAQEHLISDILISLLSQQLQENQPKESAAHLLFLTINGERHKLGLYLSAAMFQQCGVTCTLIHEDLPITEIPVLCQQMPATGVALSFSQNYQASQARKDLATLRQILPADKVIIAGGHAVRKKFLLPGVLLCAELKEIGELCRKEFGGI